MQLCSSKCFKKRSKGTEIKSNGRMQKKEHYLSWTSAHTETVARKKEKKRLNVGQKQCWYPYRHIWQYDTLLFTRYITSQHVTVAFSEHTVEITCAIPFLNVALVVRFKLWDHVSWKFVIISDHKCHKCSHKQKKNHCDILLAPLWNCNSVFALS